MKDVILEMIAYNPEARTTSKNVKSKVKGKFFPNGQLILLKGPTINNCIILLWIELMTRLHMNVIISKLFLIDDRVRKAIQHHKTGSVATREAALTAVKRELFEQSEIEFKTLH